MGIYPLCRPSSWPFVVDDDNGGENDPLVKSVAGLMCVAFISALLGVTVPCRSTDSLVAQRPFSVTTCPPLSFSTHRIIYFDSVFDPSWKDFPFTAMEDVVRRDPVFGPAPSRLSSVQELKFFLLITPSAYPAFHRQNARCQVSAFSSRVSQVV